jgi:hypothetical protein
VVRAGGLEPPRASARRIFLPTTAFAAARGTPARLWSGLSLRRAPDDSQGLGAARLVSTPSTMLSHHGLARDRHFTGFPEFEQFYTARFHAGTQFGLSPLRLPFRHARIHRVGL